MEMYPSAIIKFSSNNYQNYNMKILTEWGFTWMGWRNNQRGEYWFLIQGILLIGFVFLPVYPSIKFTASDWFYINSSIAIVIGLIGIIFLGKGLLDLGNNITPLPYPKADGKLIQTGVYGVVRHPLYSGLIFTTLAWSIWQLSLSHLLVTIIIFSVLNAKSSREEIWLTEKFPEYLEYQQKVKKFIPGLF